MWEFLIRIKCIHLQISFFLCRIIDINTGTFQRKLAYPVQNYLSALRDKGLEGVFEVLDAMVNIPVLHTNHFCSKYYTKGNINVQVMLPLVPIYDYFSFITDSWDVKKAIENA